MNAFSRNSMARRRARRLWQALRLTACFAFAVLSLSGAGLAVAQETPLTLPSPDIGVSPAVNAPAVKQGPEAPQLGIEVPLMQLTNATSEKVGDITNIDIPWLAQYMAGIFRYSVGIAGMLAAVMMMIGGVQYLTAGGDASKVAKGKQRITDALLGLVIVVGSYLLMYSVNPDLVTFSSLKIIKLEPVTYVANETPEFLVDEPVPPAASQLTGSATPKAGPAGAGGGNVPSLKQYDYRNVGYLNKGTPQCVTVGNAGKKPFTIASSGCGVTSAAMVVAYYHREIDPKTLPPIMAQLATDNNMRPCNKTCGSCSGTAGSFFISDSTMGKYGLVGKNIGGGAGVQAKAMDLLRQGKPLVALMKGPSIFTCGGHYIVLTGVDGNGNIIINDPGHNDSKTYTDDTCPSPPAKSGPTNIYPRSVPPSYVFTSKGGGGLTNLWYISPKQ